MFPFSIFMVMFHHLFTIMISELVAFSSSQFFSLLCSMSFFFICFQEFLLCFWFSAVWFDVSSDYFLLISPLQLLESVNLSFTKFVFFFFNEQQTLLLIVLEARSQKSRQQHVCLLTWTFLVYSQCLLALSSLVRVGTSLVPL